MTGANGTWLNPLREWLPALIDALQRQDAIVRIAVADVRGSAPREPGVAMLVGHAAVVGTIGGGQLEWQALAAARLLLEPDAPRARLQPYVLGADVGQCCGGVVQVWMERYERADLDWLRAARLCAQRGPAMLVTRLAGGAVQHHVRAEAPEAAIRLARPDEDQVEVRERLDVRYPPLWLYGAGHVGQALVRILVDLPLQLTWIDSRSGMFPADVPAPVHLLHSADPAASVAGAPAGCRFLVMTHSHALDFALCSAILHRDDFAWAGLIGSKSKAARFRSRLARAHHAAEAIARLVCPIGLTGIDSKWPAAIAVGVAAELLREVSGAGTGALVEPDAGQPCIATACHRCESR
jgi:xanthine dehydrogenase accessory factor